MKNEIKRPWLLLGWDRYYPSGGLQNILAAFATEAEARNSYDVNTTNPFPKTHPDYAYWSQEWRYLQVVNIIDYLEGVPNTLLPVAED